MNALLKTTDTLSKNTSELNTLSANSTASQSALMPTQIVRLKNANLNVRYAKLGDPQNPAVILLHGVPENLQAWYAVAPLLAQNYYVLAMDWPGFGGSDALPSGELYNSRHFAQLVVDFMDTLEISDAHLVATDISLLPALLAGLKHPERIAKLVVMDGIPFPRSQYASWELNSFARKGSIRGKALVNWFPGISAKIARFKGFYRGHSIPVEVREEFAKDGRSKANQHAFLSYFQNFHVSQEYFAKRAQDLTTPVLVLWGSHDRFIDKLLAFEIEESLPNAQLKIIDRAGHYVHMDKPKALAEAVSAFLK